jgi:hypothetical protein
MNLKDKGYSDKVFVLYDGRAKLGDTDDASVLCSAESEAEAWDDSKSFRDIDGVWYEYDLMDEGEDYPVARNEKQRPDIGKGILL